MKNDIRALSGNWDAGYVLDKHVLSSTYVGDNEFGHPQFDTTRSEVGEALYQLKYRGDFSLAGPLAAEIERHIIPRLDHVGLIVPMPATNPRPRQPVTEIARALGQRLSTPLFENLLVRIASPAGAPALKDLVGKDAKVEALKGRFAINDAIPGEGRWNALLVDDLFDTGASMEAACALLGTYPKIDRIFVAALTWK